MEPQEQRAIQICFLHRNKTIWCYLLFARILPLGLHVAASVNYLSIHSVLKVYQSLLLVTTHSFSINPKVARNL